MDEFKEIYKTKEGFTKVMLCSEPECELKIKEEIGVSSRCIPFCSNQNKTNTCICCNKQTNTMVIFGKSY